MRWRKQGQWLRCLIISEAVSHIHNQATIWFRKAYTKVVWNEYWKRKKGISGKLVKSVHVWSFISGHIPVTVVDSLVLTNDHGYVRRSHERELGEGYVGTLYYLCQLFCNLKWLQNKKRILEGPSWAPDLPQSHATIFRCTGWSQVNWGGRLTTLN